MFRGREIQYPQLGRKILDDIAEAISHVGRVEVYPEQEGRNMTMLLTPGKATRRQREAIEALQAEALEKGRNFEDKRSNQLQNLSRRPVKRLRNPNKILRVNRKSNKRERQCQK